MTSPTLATTSAIVFVAGAALYWAFQPEFKPDGELLVTPRYEGVTAQEVAFGKVADRYEDFAKCLAQADPHDAEACELTIVSKPQNELKTEGELNIPAEDHF